MVDGYKFLPMLLHANVSTSLCRKFGFTNSIQTLYIRSLLIVSFLLAHRVTLKCFCWLINDWAILCHHLSHATTRWTFDEFLNFLSCSARCWSKNHSSTFYIAIICRLLQKNSPIQIWLQCQLAADQKTVSRYYSDNGFNKCCIPVTIGHSLWLDQPLSSTRPLFSPQFNRWQQIVPLPAHYIPLTNAY